MTALTQNEYEKHINEIFERNKNLLLKKRQEYASGLDPLQNFKDGADMSGKTQDEILWFYCLKHLCSIKDIIFRKGITSQDVTKELLEEKTGDIINYMVLLNLIRDDEIKHNEELK